MCGVGHRAHQNREVPEVHTSQTLPLRWPGQPSVDAAPAAAQRTEREEVGPTTGPTLSTPDVTSSGIGAPTPDRPDVEVRTSTRRRKTATAFWEGGRIVVVMPSHVRRADRAELVDWLVARVLAKRPRAGASDEALGVRAAALADRFVDGVRPSAIRWVTNQEKRWGSCSAESGEIRLSHRLQGAPEWVVDATIVHELAHLVHPNHSTGFHSLANRHPRQHDATLFLEGYSLGIDWVQNEST
jgi:hypothetical protein